MFGGKRGSEGVALAQALDSWYAPAVTALATPNVYHALGTRRARRLRNLALGAGRTILNTRGGFVPRHSTVARNRLHVIPVTDMHDADLSFSPVRNKLGAQLQVGQILTSRAVAAHTVDAEDRIKHDAVVVRVDSPLVQSPEDKAGIVVHDLVHAD